jgi:hypothetical protein
MESGMAFLSPTKGKLVRALVVASVLPVAFALQEIPVAWDVLDLRQLARVVLAGLLGGPVRLFDLLTDSAFAPRSEGFIVFPTLPQIAFALACDALLFYVVACAWVAWRRRRRSDAEDGERSRR